MLKPMETPMNESVMKKNRIGSRRIAGAIVALVLASQSVPAYESAICRSYVAGLSEVTPWAKESISEDWNSVVDALNRSSEGNAPNWYFSHVLVSPKGTAGSIARNSREVDRVLRDRV